MNSLLPHLLHRLTTNHDDTTDDNTNSEAYISISDEHLMDGEAKVKPKSKSNINTKEESASEEKRKKI